MIGTESSRWKLYSRHTRGWEGRPGNTEEVSEVEPIHPLINNSVQRNNIVSPKHASKILLTAILQRQNSGKTPGTHLPVPFTPIHYELPLSALVLVLYNHSSANHGSSPGR